jgi:Ca2+-binding EF-hand superfamily protein
MHRALFLIGGLLLYCVLQHSASVSGQDAPKKLPPQLVALIKGSADDFIKQFDKKKQGYLTKDDVPPFLAANFDKFDTNKDGKLDKGEVERMLQVLRKRLEAGGPPAKGDGPPLKGPGGLTGKSLADFDVLDKKADGRITRDMVKGTIYESLFDTIDTNKDGKIDRKEFEAYIKKAIEKDKK